MSKEEALKIHLTVDMQQLIRAYQVMGHNHAKIDPLGIMERPKIQALLPETYGILESQMNTVIKSEDIKIQNVTFGFLTEKKEMTIRDFVNTLERIYCGSVGAIYAYSVFNEM